MQNEQKHCSYSKLKDTGERDFVAPVVDHKVAQLFGVPTDYVAQVSEAATRLGHVADLLHLTVIQEYAYEWRPQGITVVLLISESHISIHTWPEFSYAYVDIITCGKQLEVADVLEALHVAFHPKQVQVYDMVARASIISGDGNSE